MTEPQSPPEKPVEPPVSHPAWPAEGEHLWLAWRAKTGLPHPTDYRTCAHPGCKVVETRKGIKAS